MTRNKRLLVSVLFIFISIFSVICSTPILAASSITLSSLGGPVGTNVTVTGTGFTADIAYQIKFGASFIVVKTGTTLPDGTISDSFIVPEYFQGPALVTVETISETTVASFTVIPSVLTNIYTGNVGQSITINGTGFAANKVISITFDSTTVQTTTSFVNGSFSTAFTVPESIGGSHLIKAADSLANYSTASFITSQLVTVTPATGVVGSNITIQGTGFKASSQITVTDGSLPVSTSPSSITSNTLGSFSATFKIPASTTGSHQLTVKDGTHQVNINYVTIANVILSRTSAVVGNEVSVTGTGFQSNKPITITLAGVNVKSTSSDATGSFNTEFIVPPVRGGNYQVVTSDGTSSISVSLAVAATADLSTASGFIGTEITISGNGFYGTVIVKFDGVEVARKAASSDGTFSVSFNIPKSSAGNHNITASDGTRSVNSVFSVTVSSTLDKSTGWVGMPLILNASGFVDSMTIKFDDTIIATLQVETTETKAVSFDVPVSESGNHIISVTDGTNTIEISFAIESDAPAVPELVFPANTGKAKATPQFEWTDVSDQSGVYYTLEIASDQSFTAGSIILKKDNLADSTYTLTKEEKLKSTKKDAPYYWRIKASDYASNESVWTTPYSFRVGFSLSDLPFWVYCLTTVVLMVLAGIAGFFIGKKPYFWKRA